jgi:hypothetical protein
MTFLIVTQTHFFIHTSNQMLTEMRTLHIITIIIYESLDTSFRSVPSSVHPAVQSQHKYLLPYRYVQIYLLHLQR